MPLLFFFFFIQKLLIKFNQSYSACGIHHIYILVIFHAYSRKCFLFYLVLLGFLFDLLHCLRVFGRDFFVKLFLLFSYFVCFVFNFFLNFVFIIFFFVFCFCFVLLFCFVFVFFFFSFSLRFVFFSFFGFFCVIYFSVSICQSLFLKFFLYASMSNKILLIHTALYIILFIYYLYKCEYYIYIYIYIM
jgi:hypothetical protein